MLRARYTRAQHLNRTIKREIYRSLKLGIFIFSVLHKMRRRWFSPFSLSPFSRNKLFCAKINLSVGFDIDQALVLWVAEYRLLYRASGDEGQTRLQKYRGDTTDFFARDLSPSFGTDPSLEAHYIPRNIYVSGLDDIRTREHIIVPRRQSITGLLKREDFTSQTAIVLSPRQIRTYLSQFFWHFLRNSER